MQSASDEWFDEAYYQRYYFNKKTSVVDPAHTERLGAFVCSYLQYLRVPVARVLDMGCGIGLWRDMVARHLPGAQYQGVEYSAYLCQRFGWQRGSVVDYPSATPYDFVICQGVLPYLGVQDLRRALANLGRLCQGALYLEAVTPPPGARVVEGDAFDALAIAPGQRVVLVGAFAPYMRTLRRTGQPFQVLELDPATLKPEELPFYVHAERAPETVARADVLIATGTTLVNGSLDGLLQCLRPGAQAAIVGPTATLWPGPFARRGATVVGGTRVQEAGALLDLLAEGGSGYHFFGKSVERVCLCV